MKISLVTVTFNAAATVERTLRSVSCQTYADYEHVIVDGASSDGTLALCRRYETSRMTIVSEPDRGLYDAMNKGLRLAGGDFVCFLNAGDQLHDADTLQQVAAVAQADNVGVVYGHTNIVDDEGHFLHRRRLSPPRLLTWNSFRQGMLVCHQSFYVNRQLAVPYDLGYRFSADFDWCIRCMQEGERRGLVNVALPIVLTDYLSEGMTTQNHRASLLERFRIMSKHYGLAATVLQHAWFVIRACAGRSWT